MVDSQKAIILKGARMHNLKNVDVSIPRNTLTVVTGVSGSGKSSLVFDTLFAESQRRYVESLSAYARQFLGKMNKPEVDHIYGISPGIAIEQKVNTRNPRSTVATSTEIYDYLKLLFARAGTTISPISGNEVKRHQVDDVVSRIAAFPENTRVYLLVQIPNSKERNKQLQVFMQNGFTRILVHEEMLDIETYLAQTPKKSSKTEKAPELFLLIDRFACGHFDEDMLMRVSDSVQTAFYEGHGECTLLISEPERPSYRELFNNRFELDGMKFEEPTVNFFSFNNPYGACATCEGYGSVIGIDEDLVVPDTSKSIFDDAIACWRGETMSNWKKQFISISRKLGFPVHKPYKELTKEQKEVLWNGQDNWEGIYGFFKDIESQTYKIQYRVMLARYRGKTTCPDCKGARLRKDAGYVKLISANPNTPNYALHDVLLMSIDDAHAYFESLQLLETKQLIADRIFYEVKSRLRFLKNVGLGYLSLNRLSNSLSGGETQRINLATSLGSSLVGSLYVLDEPSIGLHSRDTENLIRVLKELRDLGNTVVVVEHDSDIMEQADYILDIGPFAGIHGGELVAAGDVKHIKKNPQSLTGKYLSGKESIPIPTHRRKSNSMVEVKGARYHNIERVDVSFPLHAFTVVTGVSGSGKSTLIRSIVYPALAKKLAMYNGEKCGTLESLGGDVDQIKQLEFVDQNPIGRNSRSNPITYVKAYDAIRDLFASQPLSRSRSYKSMHFSFNVEGGRCDTCQGEGEITIEMQFMADIHLPCDACHGARFKDEILDITVHGKNISEVLNLSVDEAMQFFSGEKSIVNRLKPLQDVGLGYIKLGQSSNTLSGGEAQRVKLATFLGRGGKAQEHTLFIFDEPTTGLHFHDIKKLLECFNALIDQGHSVLVIEHNMDVIKCADWIIDLGPDAGIHGGKLVYQGHPEGLLSCKESRTAKYLTV